MRKARICAECKKVIRNYGMRVPPSGLKPKYYHRTCYKDICHGHVRRRYEHDRQNEEKPTENEGTFRETGL